MYGSLEASATSKYRCLVIFEALESVSGSPKTNIFQGMARRKRGVSHPLQKGKKALVFRSNPLQPAYFFAPSTSKGGGEPCTIQKSNHNAAVLIIFTLCWLL